MTVNEMMNRDKEICRNNNRKPGEEEKRGKVEVLHSIGIGWTSLFDRS